MRLYSLVESWLHPVEGPIIGAQQVELGNHAVLGEVYPDIIVSLVRERGPCRYIVIPLSLILVEYLNIDFEISMKFFR